MPMHRTSLPLRSTLAALTLLAVALFAAPATGQAESGPAFQAEGDDTLHDITFPLPQGSYAPLYDSYDDARSGGRVHRANDIMADKLTPVHAVVGGEIIFAPGADGEAKPSYGYMIRLAGDDGMFYSYVHLNDDVDPEACDRSGGPEVAYAPGIEEGVLVERGQHIGWVGSSGNAACEGPHLHFEIGEDPQFQVRHNPMASLEAAEARGDFPEAPNPDPTIGADDGAGDDAAGEDAGDDAAGDDAAGDGPSGPSEHTRLAGDTRLQTAVALSERTRDTARAVVVVPADSHVEALVAAPLAGLVDAPILLSGPDGLADAVADEVRRLGPSSAYVIGTTAQLSAQVEADLTAAGVQFQARIAEADRYELSAAVAEEILSYPELDGGLDQAILAVGESDDPTRAWPDALSASALAAASTTPILLTRGDRLPDPIADLLTAERPDRLVVVGGEAAITSEVVEEAAALAGAEAIRLAGASRYETSVAVAAAAVRAGLDDGEVWVATGRNYPDALAAGPAAAASGSPLVLVDGLDAAGSPASNQWLGSNADALVVVGGDAVVSDQVIAALTG
jgi:putative cell wall-binding protein